MERGYVRWDEYLNRLGPKLLHVHLSENDGTADPHLPLGAAPRRDSKPAVEWSWEGMAEMDECSGRGWATLDGDELRGMIFIHGGDHSDFVARKPKKKP